MKDIAKIAKRLMLVFLALVVSSTMFLSSPALADTSLSQEEIEEQKYIDQAPILPVTPENFETEVVKANKPVIALLLTEYKEEFGNKDSFLEDRNYFLNDFKRQIVDRFSYYNQDKNEDVFNAAEAGKYKFVLGEWKDFKNFYSVNNELFKKKYPGLSADELNNKEPIAKMIYNPINPYILTEPVFDSYLSQFYDGFYLPYKDGRPYVLEQERQYAFPVIPHPTRKIFPLFDELIPYVGN
jgi:hypothetical protein